MCSILAPHRGPGLRGQEAAQRLGVAEIEPDGELVGDRSGLLHQLGGVVAQVWRQRGGAVLLHVEPLPVGDNDWFQPGSQLVRCRVGQRDQVEQGARHPRDTALATLRDGRGSFENAWETWDREPANPSAISAYRAARDAWVETVLRDVVGWGAGWTIPLANAAEVRSPDHTVTVRPTRRQSHRSRQARDRPGDAGRDVVGPVGPAAGGDHHGVGAAQLSVESDRVGPGGREVQQRPACPASSRELARSPSHAPRCPADRWSVTSLAGRMVAIVNLGRWVSRLDGRERLEDLVGVHSVPGNDPAVAWLQ
jgi:hypothetical protein